MRRAILAGLAIWLSVAGASGADRRPVLPPISDVGAPFDVREFCSVSVPDDKNAFTYYRRAARLLVTQAALVNSPNPNGRQTTWDRFLGSLDETLEKGWPRANEDVRLWLAGNDLALETWKRGTECADAIEIPPAEINVLGPYGTFYQPARDFARLACLEAARLSAGSRPAEAWTWYRANLRCSCHLGMHTGMIGRLSGSAIYSLAAEAALRWAARPEITARDLRQALADTFAANGMMPPPSDSLKCNYVWCRTGIDGAIESVKPNYLAPFLKMIGYHERLRRSQNLMYANLLSQADRPRYRRAPIGGRLGLFELDASMPRSPKVLADGEIERRILSIPGPDAAVMQYLLPPPNIFNFFDHERTRQSALILALALQLHYREHGQFPATLSELVKNGYLKSIPADPFGKSEPFHYRRETDPRQGAVLWSVWWDGIDQEGKVDAFRENAKDTGDRIFKIAAPR
jgi:hypothetical protein